MIRGVGTDIVEISRIAKTYKRFGARFLNRVYTQKEQTYCLSKAKPEAHLAVRFAAKEAVVKALGTGFQNNRTFLDIEILNDALGRPVVHFQDGQIYISLSHSKEYATAVAIYLC